MGSTTGLIGKPVKGWPAFSGVKLVRGTGFEPVRAPSLDQAVTKDGTQHSTHAAAYQSLARIVEAWAFLPVELQRSISIIVEQHVTLSLGRPAGPGEPQKRGNNERTA
jgi:hypothetical protein